MTSRFTPGRWARRLPAYAVNGLSVAIGIGVIHLLFGALGGPAAAAFAGSGAVCTSLADLPDTLGRSWRRVLAAAVLSTASALTVAVLKPHLVALGFGITTIAFLGMMTLAWGPRAGPVSFAPILALVFAMAAPGNAHAPLAPVAWSALGALVYLVWSVATAAWLQRRFRRLALVAAMRAVSGLLRSRASLLQAAQASGGAAATLGTWIADEAALAERLQVARDLVFDAADAALARRETAILLHVIDLRDVLLASRLDLELFGTDTTATRVLDRVAGGLRRIAVALDQIGDALRDDRPPAPDAAVEPALSQPFEGVAMPEADSRGRILPTLTRRLQLLSADVAAMRRLAHGQEEKLPLSRSQLQSFVGPEAWPLDALRPQLSRSSPVLRHAVRMSLALATAYYAARFLPWASHPHWLVLSVAVVLRGNLEQTLTRRNARVLGTMFGCLLVLLFARSNSPPLLELVFLGSVGIAHSFVNVRYWVTATAATVMALLQSHLADPGVGFAIGERLADTVLGAALGWAFSYVLPSWERHSVPQTIARALAALDEYATRVLAADAGSAVEQRLARRTAYDALGALAGAAQRSAVEPRRARLPIDDMAALLDHGQRLMAHLSSIRLMLARGTAQLREPGAAAALQGASRELSDALTRQGLSDGPDSAPDTQRVDTLPQEPPSDDPLPWLLRRLQLSLHDARRVRVAASAALARLA
jgi:uncharacterized membrane protein YccC